ncbi:hypothetical protein B0J14DRAFT_615536 [Halenospora varia]|nr:hypothetical protein B0J14DRAFT_615536 [Halenospora varia]
MVDLGGLRNGIRTGQTNRNWDGRSLRDFVGKLFPNTKELSDEVKLKKLFNAYHLQRFASIQIIWTSNLADHLQLEDDDTSAKIFSHVHSWSFTDIGREIRCSVRFKNDTDSSDSDIFPQNFIEETLRILLFCCLAIQQPPLKAAHRKIQKFEFWHDRLVMLKQAFDEAAPKTVRQWWSDRRKPVYIEGALQVYKAYHPSGP